MSQKKPNHIAVVIPAHNEADAIRACLDALQGAIARLATTSLGSTTSVTVWVIADSCTDETHAIVESHCIIYPNLKLCTVTYRCVGKVRNFGIQHAIAAGADWIACTDADSLVSSEWLIAQIQLQCDMICGVVEVADWSHLSADTRELYLAHYQDRMGHRHIHGANLSFSATAYTAVGGFLDLACHEDVALVKSFEAQGYNIIWSNQVRVVTSSRLLARAEGGFASFLTNLERKNRQGVML